MTAKILMQDITQNFDSYKGRKETVEGYISNLELGEKKDKTKFLKCTIGDTTGSMNAKLWDEGESNAIINEIKDAGRSASYMVAEILIKEYQGKPDITIENIRIDISKPLKDFMEKSKIVPNEYYARIVELISRVKNPGYSELLKSIFLTNYQHKTDENKELAQEIRNKFLTWAAATGHHHNYLYGLLEHTINVVETALFFAARYKDTYEINEDILITGGLLHDIGKIYEYDCVEGINYAEEGNYIYHTVSGSMLVHELNIKFGLNISRTDLMKIIHIISSHHGEYAEHTPNAFCYEAHLLALADNADAKANGIARSFASGTARKMKNRMI